MKSDFSFLVVSIQNVRHRYLFQRRQSTVSTLYEYLIQENIHLTYKGLYTKAVGIVWLISVYTVKYLTVVESNYYGSKKIISWVINLWFVLNNLNQKSCKLDDQDVKESNGILQLLSNILLLVSATPTTYWSHTGIGKSIYQSDALHETTISD